MEGDKPKIQMFRDAEAISKITKEPVEVEVGIYGLSEDGESVEKNGAVKGWLHRLDWLERNHIRTAASQAYRYFKEQGEEKETISAAVGAIVSRMTVYLSLRVGPEPKAERFFPSKEVLMDYPMEEGIMELHRRHHEEFSLSEKEWGNWLRARSLEISSDLPEKQAVAPLDEKSQN